MERLKALEQRRKELEDEIRETKERLPAHSTKPPIMMALLDLEDEYERVVKKIHQLKS